MPPRCCRMGPIGQVVVATALWLAVATAEPSAAEAATAGTVPAEQGGATAAAGLTVDERLSEDWGNRLAIADAAAHQLPSLVADMSAAFGEKPLTHARHNDSSKVFVMLPLETVTSQSTLADREGLAKMLDAMVSANIDGFMLDVWWGLTEKQPRKYNFSVYREVFDLARERNFKVQAVAAFHQCGGNVGDTCDVPLPEFVRNVDGIWYTDAEGWDDREYISLFADNVTVGDRTPMQMYKDWMAAFAMEFADDLGSLIVEIQVGMGPCGELRYPSYQLSKWEFCGVGEFQSWDFNALELLKVAAEVAGKPAWGVPPIIANGRYNSKPHKTLFFTELFKRERGDFFLRWYSGNLMDHSNRVLSAARQVFEGRVPLSGKVAGIHWWYNTESHAAELTAGYYNANSRNAYSDIAQVFKKSDVHFDFTCLEMKTDLQDESRSHPEALVQQVKMAAAVVDVPLGGENALQVQDLDEYEQLASHKNILHSVTFLRLTSDLISGDNLKRFAWFVANMHGASHTVSQDPQAGSATKPALRGRR